MPNLVSPGVQAREISLTATTPTIATTGAAIVGTFPWGPAETPILVNNETVLATRFGIPNSDTYTTFLAASSFLAYGNNLRVVRVVGADANTADTAGGSKIKNDNDVITTDYSAKYPGELGNSLGVSICPANRSGVDLNIAATAVAGVLADVVVDSNIINGDKLTVSIDSVEFLAYASGIIDADLDLNNLTFIATPPALDTAVVTSIVRAEWSNFEVDSTNAFLPGSITISGKTVTGTDTFFAQTFIVNDSITVSTSLGARSLRVASIESETSMTLAYDFTGTLTNSGDYGKEWYFAPLFDAAPSTTDYALSKGGSYDEVHAVVFDITGSITGTIFEAIEPYGFLSMSRNALSEDGTRLNLWARINLSSQYLRARATLADTAALAETAFAYTTATYVPMTGGVSDDVLGANAVAGYDELDNKELIDISLLIAVPPSNATAATAIANKAIALATQRKDCVALVSAYKDATVNVSRADALSNLLAFRTTLASSSYAMMDSGFKFMYDKYNDEYRWIPLCGDIAGLCVNADLVRDPWFSPAGFQRGQIRNSVRLAFNPNQTERDELYKVGINPVTTFQAQGTVLYGDKTLLSKPSAFDRINVRRLMIFIEKTISIAAQSVLNEFNDEFTRAQFISIVEPFLRNVQGRRGITDFKVVADNSVNTPDVVDANQFIANIYVKPARSINYIYLNFVAVRTGVSFDEIVGS